MSTTTTYPFDPTTDIPSLTGKVIFITGANTGLGKATAIELTKHSPAHVYITSRDSAKGNAALDEVRETASENTKVSLLELDLSSFESIKSAAAEFLKREDRLDVLLLNAGVMGVPPVLTKEGYEMHMGINHLGHALLLKLFKPVLDKTPDARAVHLSSAGFRHVGPAGIEFETLKSAKSETALPFRYAQSKLACLLYAREAAKRYPDFKNIAINPGEVQTELFTREAGDDLMKHLQDNVASKVAIPISEGVKNHLWATTSPDIENGEFYEPVGKTGGLEGHGLDDEMAKKLWDWTEEQLKDQAS
ncbi:related to alcohol dehydrogenase homolog Bli-4 [Fusarium proliferatum]|nr:related to alcohol dehydrogenase homolog Bli-4 [Fusarium proliferatum]